GRGRRGGCRGPRPAGGARHARLIPRRSTERGRPPAELTRWTRARVLVMGGLLMAALGATLIRAVSLQVIQRARLASMASDQSVREMEIPARRGDIYDRRGIPLAQSVEVDSLWLDP